MNILILFSFISCFENFFGKDRNSRKALRELLFDNPQLLGPLTAQHMVLPWFVIRLVENGEFEAKFDLVARESV